MPAKRNFLNTGSWNTSVDYIPWINDGGVWKETHAWVNAGGVWTEMPNWKSAGPYPLSAMTANNAPSPYVAACSSEYSSGYTAWRAFNKSNDTATGWAAAEGRSSDWISLYFGTPLKNIRITLYNRTRASLVNGVIAATIQGSNDGSAWTNIGTISGRDGDTSALGTTHDCNNYNDTYTYIRLNITDWNNKNASADDYVAIGEIYVYGKAAQ